MRVVRRYGGLAFSLLLLGLVILAWFQRQAIYDWTRLRNYQPPAMIVSLATDTQMSSKGRHIFYVQHPTIEDKSSFNEHCGQNEQTIILGCYVARQGIYVFDVEDPRLSGIEQVTAAHEMLHAAYDRLNKTEKTRLKTLIDRAYQDVSSERIRKTIEQYSEAGADIVDELHSILGTEVRSLPSELETYYQKYFTDRQAVVGFAESYDQAFEDIKNKVETYDSQLAALKQQIDSGEQTLNQQNEALIAKRSQLDQQLAAGQVAAYNSNVPGYNAQVRAYNNLVAQTKQLIDTYNQILDERNALALEEQQLYKAIDSRLAPQESR